MYQVLSKHHATVALPKRRQGTTNYWDLKLPRQTEDYVPQFMALLAISRDPVKYGFDAVALDDPMQFDEIALTGAVDLRALAKLADCSYDDLKELNPQVIRFTASGAHGFTTVSSSAPTRSSRQPSSANGSEPLTTRFGRNRFIGSASAILPLRSARDSSDSSRNGYASAKLTR